MDRFFGDGGRSVDKYNDTSGLPGLAGMPGKSNCRPTPFGACPRCLGSVWDGPAWKDTDHASRPARDWHVPLIVAQASARTRTAAIAHASLRRLWGPSRSGHFCTVFRNFTH